MQVCGQEGERSFGLRIGKDLSCREICKMRHEGSPREMPKACSRNRKRLLWLEQNEPGVST